MHVRIALALVAVAALGGCSSMPGMHGIAATSSPAVAVADLASTSGNAAPGTVTFMAQGDRLTMNAGLSGLTPGRQGFHSEEHGDCSAGDASSAGGYFNPLGNGPTGIVGRSVVVHKDVDDYRSQPAGNSGARVACGVIRRV